MVYTTGDVTVTLDSSEVTGNGTDWTTLLAPLYFKCSRADEKIYSVANVVDTTTIQLTTNYEGVTGSGLTYSLNHFFSSNYGIPLPTSRDFNLTNTLTEILLKCETLLLDYDSTHSEVATSQGLKQYTTGTLHFNNDTTTLIGYGTSWTTLDAATTLYLKRESESAVYEILSIEDDTNLTLTTPYSSELSLVLPDYDSTTIYYPGDTVTYLTLDWAVKANTLITAIPPILDYDSSTQYSLASVVQYSNVNYIWISNDTTSIGITPPNATYWNIATAEEAASDNDYWDVYRGESYQIVQDTSPNYKLPLFSTGDQDIWQWASFALYLLDNQVVALV